MVRKRAPLVVSGETVELAAPGLNAFERRGRLELYWKPNAEARKRGYVPRSVRLHFDLTTIAGRLDLEHRCRVLNSEMFAWLGDPEGEKRLVYDGTVGALIRCYETDKTSPTGVSGRARRGFMATGVARLIAPLASVALTA